MSKKRIFTVGFELPGEEFEHVDFDSDQTLLDADIVLFQPSLGSCHFEYGQQWEGKPILSESDSFSKKSRVDHWHSEIVEAVNVGKLVIVYLAKPVEYFRYTGSQQFSGSGRSRVTTKTVSSISSYEAVPKIKRVTAKSGSAIRLEKDGSFLAEYWNALSVSSPYEVEIEGDFTKVLMRSRTGDRVVGATLRTQRGGNLLFLPPIAYDPDVFIRDDEDDEEADPQYWTDEALQFGKRLVGYLVALFDGLKQDGGVTPTPNWANKRIGAALVRTPDLFRPAKYLKENPSDTEYARRCREAIFSTAGEIADFPPPPVENGSAKLIEAGEVAATAPADS